MEGEEDLACDDDIMPEESSMSAMKMDGDDTIRVSSVSGSLHVHNVVGSVGTSGIRLSHNRMQTDERELRILTDSDEGSEDCEEEHPAYPSSLPRSNA